MDGLTIADFLLIAEAVLDVDAERLAYATDLGVAESALAAPFAGWGDTEFYPDPAVKAAVLCSRIVRNHPLPDGNKRVAYLAMRELLARNGHQWMAPEEDDTVTMIEGLAARALPKRTSPPGSPSMWPDNDESPPKRGSQSFVARTVGGGGGTTPRSNNAYRRRLTTWRAATESAPRA